MNGTVTMSREWHDEQIHLTPEQWNKHWRNFHARQHLEGRLIALGRTDIIEDAEKYAEERTNND